MTLQPLQKDNTLLFLIYMGTLFYVYFENELGVWENPLFSSGTVISIIYIVHAQSVFEKQSGNLGSQELELASWDSVWQGPVVLIADWRIGGLSGVGHPFYLYLFKLLLLVSVYTYMYACMHACHGTYMEVDLLLFLFSFFVFVLEIYFEEIYYLT